MSKLRFNVVEAAFKKKALEVPIPREHPSEYFGKYVFNKEKMHRYLSPDTYRQLCDVIEHGSRLDLSVADEKMGTGVWRNPYHSLVSATYRGYRREA